MTKFAPAAHLSTQEVPIRANLGHHHKAIFRAIRSIKKKNVSELCYNLSMNNPTAIIVKGNPKYIENNPEADSFYKEIKIFLETLGYKVSFDKGEPHTVPEKADLWIGHSKGVDRLRFAPEGTQILMFGSSHQDAVNHPDDDSDKIKYPSDASPNKYHYEFTDKMKYSILDVTERIMSKS